jgi:hypothetical protein
MTRDGASREGKAAAQKGAGVAYALLLLQGNPEASRRRWGTDVVFLVDRSRSMWRAHEKSAEAVLKAVLGELGQNTRFGLVTFHREAAALVQGLRPASDQARAQAIAALGRQKSQNGTSLAAGLAKAYGLLGKGQTARRRLVVVLTDGFLPERERQQGLWPAAPAGTELLFLVGRPHRGLSHRMTEGPLASLASQQGGLAYAFDPLRREDAQGDGASHQETGALVASLARPGRLTDLSVRVDGTPVTLPHKDLALLGGHLAFHKTLGLPKGAQVTYGYWGQRRQETLAPRRMPAAWARHLQALFDKGSVSRAGVGPDLSLVVVHPDDAFGRDRLAFAKRWGDRFFSRMSPMGELQLQVGPFGQGEAGAPDEGGSAKPLDEGRLTKRIVRQLLTTSYVKQATRCYQDTGPRFKEGQAVLYMDLTQGEVTDAWIEHSTMGDGALHACLVKAALDLVVERSHADETLYRVTYPMRFRAADRSVDEVRGWRPPLPRALPNPLRGLRD